MLLPGYVPIAIIIKMELLGFCFSCPVFDERLLVKQPRVKVIAKDLDLDKLQGMQYSPGISKVNNLNNRGLAEKEVWWAINFHLEFLTPPIIQEVTERSITSHDIALYSVGAK